MTLTVDKIRLPITQKFEVLDSDTDDRFKKVKVWVAHSGTNLNNTSFTKETLESMADSLSYVPIVGFVENDSEGDKDFSDHRSRIVIKDNDIEMEYLGQPYGFIPEEPNAQIEYRDGKEWLTTEGYVWTKFKEGIEIIEGGNNRKSQSMEIDNINGFVDDDGLLNVTSARFSALCVLGDEHQPAMTGSTIEFFSTKDYKEEMKQMMYEFSRKGVSGDLEKEEKKEFDVTEEVVVEEIENDTTEETEQVKDEVAEENEFSSEEDTEDESSVVQDDEENSEESDEVAESEQDFELSFSFSHEDIRTKLYHALRALEDSTDKYHYIVETHDDTFVFAIEDWGSPAKTFIRASYGVDGDNVTISDKTEVLSMFVTEDEKTDIEGKRSEIEQLTSRLTELQEFKNDLERSEKEQIIESYSEDLTSEELESFKASIDNTDATSLEKEIVFSIFKKKSGKDTDGSNDVSVQSYSLGGSVGRYGDLDRFF